MNFTHSLITIIIVAVVTILLRFLPFLVFKNKTPKAVIFLGKALPYSIMGMPVVYCLKGISFINAPHGIPEIIAVLLVVLLHKLWHNTLISIALPTAVYLLLIQLVF